MRWLFRLIGVFFSFVWRLFWRLVWIVLFFMHSCFWISLVSERGFPRSAEAGRAVGKDWSTKH